MNLKSKRTAGFGLLAMSIALFMTASNANAATLNVVGGQLLGATGVIVDGNSYDVAFLDGTCIALYSGCDAVSDFTFQSETEAVLASQALLDQVFLDGAELFDSDPTLTAGCTSAQRCMSFVPFGLSGALVRVTFALNNAPPFMDSEVIVATIDPSSDLSETGNANYAVWHPVPVPEPGTAVLMGLGLLAMSVRSPRASRTLGVR